MAQTKSRAPAKKRSQGSRKSKAASRRKASSSSRSQSKPSTNGTARLDSARHTVEDKAKDAGKAVGSAASKAKVPLIAGGAALAGAAGGAVLGARQARHHKGIGMAVSRRPQVKMDSHDLAETAKKVGSFGVQMGQLASELQRAREESNGGKRRSPIEVVLEGLTARRSGS